MENKTTEQHFDTLIAEAMKIGIEKMSIYGTSWTSYRPLSLMTRMLNKGKRVVTIQENRENKVGEKISGEFKEILNYATLLGMKIEKSIDLHVEFKAEEVNEYREMVFKKAKDLMIKKNHDYGEAWRDMSQEEIIDEINVKIRRMKSVWKIQHSPSHDNVYDIINYCSFALILIEEKIHEDL